MTVRIEGEIQVKQVEVLVPQPASGRLLAKVDGAPVQVSTEFDGPQRAAGVRLPASRRVLTVRFENQ